MKKTIRLMFVLVFAMSAGVALGGGKKDHHGRSVKVKQSITGTVVSVQVYNPVTGEMTPKSINDGNGRGAPGRTTFRSLVRNGEPMGLCDDGLRMKRVPEEFEIVITFWDGSLLFAVLDPSSNNSFCVDLSVIPPIVERHADLVVTGGTRRFKGATGHLHDHIFGQNLGPVGLGKITGTLSGEVVLARD